MTEEKLILGKESLNQTHLTSADVFGAVLVFGSVGAMVEIA